MTYAYPEACFITCRCMAMELEMIRPKHYGLEDNTVITTLRPIAVPYLHFGKLETDVPNIQI